MVNFNFETGKNWSKKVRNKRYDGR